MGKYAAHRVDDLPAVIAARIDRTFDALFGTKEFTEREHAEAQALLDAAADPVQRSLDLTPLPDSTNVYAQQNGSASVAIVRGKGTV